MIPVFDVRRLPPVDLEHNGSMPDEVWEDGGSPDPSNAEYGEWHEVSGHELDLLLEWEKRELRRLDRASASPGDFEESAANLVSDPDNSGWDLTELSEFLDFGIVSCVAALNFLRVPTTSSCRGHFGSAVGREVPYVRFVADDLDTHTWQLIRSLALQSGCQLVGCGGGLGEIVGHTCAELLNFAQLVRQEQP